MSGYTPTPPDPHYALGVLSMASTLALRDLPKEPKQAQQTLRGALEDAKPHLSAELRAILERTR